MNAERSLPDARVGSHVRLARDLFDWFVLQRMRRHFHRVLAFKPLPDVRDRARIIFVANHVSWWDGLFLARVQRLLAPGHSLYSVMLAREFDQTFWFKWVGVLPMTPGSPSSVRYLLERLKWMSRGPKPQKFICSFFPQGEIKPSFARPLGFAPGLRAVAQAMAPVTLVPVAIHIEPLNEPRPHAFIAFGAPIDHDGERLDVAKVEEGLTGVVDQLLNLLSERGERLFSDQHKEAIPHVSLL